MCKKYLKKLQDFTKTVLLSALVRVGYNLSIFLWTCVTCKNQDVIFFFFPNMKIKPKLEFKWIPELNSLSITTKNTSDKALILFFSLWLLA